MKKKTFVILAAAFVALLAAAAIAYSTLAPDYQDELRPSTVVPNTEKQPEAAEDFAVYDINGTKVSLSQFSGKPIVLDFWAPWCGPCKTELPYFNELYQKYGNDVEFMMVCTKDDDKRTVDEIKKFLSDGGYTFPVYFDTDLEGELTYGVYAIPRTIFIDKNGYIAFDHTGYTTKDELELYIKAIL